MKELFILHLETEKNVKYGRAGEAMDVWLRCKPVALTLDLSNPEELRLPKSSRQHMLSGRRGSSQTGQNNLQNTGEGNKWIFHAGDEKNIKKIVSLQKEVQVLLLS